VLLFRGNVDETPPINPGRQMRTDNFGRLKMMHEKLNREFLSRCCLLGALK